MWRILAQAVAGVAAVAAVLFVAFTAAFRTKFPPVLGAIRRFNRDVTNPRQMKQAGRPDAHASIVTHVGRSSGRSYQTPVVAVPADDGFAVALPYGPGADWVRNVLAAGAASLDHEGQTIPVDRPRLVGAEANAWFPRKEQRMHRLYGVDDFLLLRPAAAGGAGRRRPMSSGGRVRPPG